MHLQMMNGICLHCNCEHCRVGVITSMCFEAPDLLMKTPVPSMTRSTPNSFHGSFVGSRFETTRIDLPSTLMCSSSTCLTSAGKVPRMVSYFNKWLACLTPPESFKATTSKLEFSRPCQQRRKLRPIRPNPLIPTLIFCSDTVTLLEPVVPCKGNDHFGTMLKGCVEGCSNSRVDWHCESKEYAVLLRLTVAA